jgi:hypothetical protein
MRKSFVATMLAVGALATLATVAFAGSFDDFVSEGRKLSDLQRAAKLRGQADGDTTWVGYNPAFAGPNNPWQVGVGAYRPFAGSNNARRGYWDFDAPVGGDSLQGWWPYRHWYSSTTGMPTDDKVRPWFFLETGNNVNYVINQGSPKRSFGVVGVWHADAPGITSTTAGTNPQSPDIVVSGTRAAWCGLRGHGDLTAIDAITGNPISAEAAPITAEVTSGSSAGGTGRSLPGYLGMWDQFMYRDLSISGRGNSPIRLRFKLRTRMSTTFDALAIRRTGWTQYDQVSTISPNLISSTDAGTNAPRDSVMVYIGKPVDPVGGSNNDYTNSAGQTRDIFDPLRRWFTEIVDFNTFRQVYGAAGNVNDGTAIPNDGFATIECGLGDTELDAIGATARVVFRNKTNRVLSTAPATSSSDDETGSYTGTYNSAYGGAAIVDDVELSLNDGGSYTTVGSFEPGDPGQNIDNSVAASVSWRTTGKPPALYPHVRHVSDVNYVDLCGQPGNENRTCNMLEYVLSMGEYPNENKAGSPGTVDYERWVSVLSPTVCLAAADDVTPNHMGITGAMADATEDIYPVFDWQAAGANATEEGVFFQNGWQAYPAIQLDGTECWSDFQRPGAILPNALDECFPLLGWGLSEVILYTSNPSGIPDSIRCVMRSLSYCYRFVPITCGDQNRSFAFDNITFALIDGGGSPAISTFQWQYLHDAFPANDDENLPGTAAFDTCAAWAKSSLNISTRTANDLRFNVAGDTSAITVSGTNVRMDVVFRIQPGPGNYVTIGDPASGLRRLPTSPTAITAGDNSFWTSYINDNGDYGTTTGHPAGSHATRWSNLVWNSARCDTNDYITAPVLGAAAGAFGNTAAGGGIFCTMYHEDELAGARASLAQLRNLCFMNDTLGPTQAPNINCGRAVEGFGTYPPAYATFLPNSYTGYPTGGASWPQTTEGTKIFPDGLFTPGTHMQYFFRRENTDDATDVDFLPDSNFAIQNSADVRRWQTWSVLPDAWKKSVYGGDGQACMLYVDWGDGSGNERIWVSVADSIGATSAAKRGAQNGWIADGNVTDFDDPAIFVYNKNSQPGSMWDKYDSRQAFGADGCGSLGSRESNPAGALEVGMDARNAPTRSMLNQYGMLFITVADAVDEILGPFNNRSQNDKKVIEEYMLDGTSSDVRGLFIMGDSFIQDLDPGAGVEPQVQGNLEANLVGADFRATSGNTENCPDLTPNAPITSNGDIYGFNNGCTQLYDVLEAATGQGQVVLEYPNNFGAGILHPPSAPEYWASIVTGVDILGVRSRFCGSSFGRLRFMFDTLEYFEGVISGSCSLHGDPLVTLDTPNNGNGPAFVDFLNLKNNPLVKGNAVITFGLSKSDRVTLKVYDVTGRLVRTLLDNQAFRAGPHDITWDGADNLGRQVPRGVYFSAFETEGGVVHNRKMTVLK